VIVLDADDRLTAGYRARVALAIPPEVKVPEAFWSYLNEIIVGYIRFEHRRENYPIKKERKRWQRIGAAVEALEAELRRLQREMPSSDSDPLWPNRALAALWEIRRKVATRNRYHEIWTTFRGRQNPYRDFLYGGVLRCWTDWLGGELRYSRSATNEVGGPTVGFFVACVAPVFGDAMVQRESIADIIDRERAEREHIEREVKRLRKQ
jgi:hypothetical protein